MKKNAMRAPLLKAGAVLLVFVLLAYLTSASPEGSVLNSAGLIIIGAFRLVHWAIALAIGLVVSIAVLIAIFLFAVFLVNREASVSMYHAVKKAVRAFCQPVCSRFGAFGQCKEIPSCPAPPVHEVTTPDTHFKEEMRAIAADEARQITEHQQALRDQFSVLTSAMQALKEQSADCASAGQLHAIASELAAFGKTLATVQTQVAALEGEINGTVRQLQGITPEKMLGDIPARLQKLEQPKEERPPFDPAPLIASIENLRMEMDELKKRKSSTAPAKAKKKP
jgi:hypothetical protein